VLIIDDEELIRTTLRMLLEPEHEVIMTQSLSEAQEQLESHQPFDVILCDMMLPDGTGETLYHWLRERTPEVLPRMIFMSGGAYTHEAQRFFAEHDVNRLQKPFPLESLLSAIESARG